MNVHRYGRNLIVHVPRLCRWAATVQIRPFPERLVFGVFSWVDEGGEIQIVAGAALVEVSLHPIRLLSDRERRRRQEQVAASAVEALVDEIEAHLRGGS